MTVLFAHGTTNPNSTAALKALAESGGYPLTAKLDADVTDADVLAATAVLVSYDASTSLLDDLPSLGGSGGPDRPLYTASRANAWVAHLGIAGSGSQASGVSTMFVLAAGETPLGAPAGTYSVLSASGTLQWVRDIAPGAVPFVIPASGSTNEYNYLVVPAGGALRNGTATHAMGLGTWLGDTDIAKRLPILEQFTLETMREVFGDPALHQPGGGEPTGEVLFSHRFVGSGAFTGDGVFSNLAGTAPTLVDAGDGEVGLRFPAGAQSLVQHVLASTEDRRVLDLVLEFEGTDLGTVELAQFRGAAKLFSANTTGSDKLQLAGVDTETTLAAPPVGKFRVTIDRNGATPSLTVYTDDTGTTVQQTIVTDEPLAALTALRLGWSSTASPVPVIVSWPILATHPNAVGPRDYSTPKPTDTTAPSVPTGLAVTGVTETALTLTWDASTDASGVASYRLQRNGVTLTGAAALTSRTFTHTGLTAGTTYGGYTVSAVDPAGNRSAESPAVSGTTSTATVPPEDVLPVLFCHSPGGETPNQSALRAALDAVLGATVSKDVGAVTAADLTGCRGVVIGRQVTAAQVEAVAGLVDAGVPVMSCDYAHGPSLGIATARATLNGAENLSVNEAGAELFGVEIGREKVLSPSGQLTYLQGIPAGTVRLTQTFSVSSDYLHTVLPAGQARTSGGAAPATRAFCYWPADDHVAKRTPLLTQFAQQLAVDLFGTSSGGGGTGSGGTNAPAPTLTVPGGLTVNPWSTFEVAAQSNQTSVVWSHESGPPLELLSSTAYGSTYRAPGLVSGAGTVLRATATNADGVSTSRTVQVTVRPVTLSLLVADGPLPVDLLYFPLVDGAEPPFVLGATEPTPENTWRGLPPLRTITGDFKPVSGTLYSRVRFEGRVIWDATLTDLQFDDCDFAPIGNPTTDYSAVNMELATSVAVFNHCRIRPQNPSGYWHSIRGSYFHLWRCLIQDCVDGPGTNVTQAGADAEPRVEGTCVQDLFYGEALYQGDDVAHCDAAQLQAARMYLDGCRLWANASPLSTLVSPYAPSVPGQAVAVTPNVSAVGLTLRRSWLAYGAQSLTMVPASKGLLPGGGVVELNRWDTRTNPALRRGGSTGPVAQRAILIDPTLTVAGMPTVTGPDTQHGNVDWDGSPVTVHRVTAAS